MPPERLFALLHTPSAIRGWWSASRAIVVAREGGLWAAAWGGDEDDPDYVSTFRIAVFDPPRRMMLNACVYVAKPGPLPFDAEFETEFTVRPTAKGSVLRVVQDGFPTDPVADAFYAGCEIGWKNTFAGIRGYLTR